MAESTHRVEIVPVVLEKHPNADALSIIRIDGYQVVGRTEDWLNVPLGAYLPPDSVVDVTRPEFAWLDDHSGKTQMRIKARRLRGEWSMGLLVPAPPGAQLGDDVAAQLGVTHWNPPEETSGGGECEKPPTMVFTTTDTPKPKKVHKTSRANREADTASLIAQGFVVGEPTYESPDGSIVILPITGTPARAHITGQYPDYDVEAFRKYGKVAFVEGETVAVTEKIHGANGRWVCVDGVMYAGSHHYWKRQDPVNLWWAALAKHPQIEEYCRKNPGTAVYGEVYGKMDLKYGMTNGNVGIVLFDIMREGKWVNYEEAFNIAEAEGLPWVPEVSRELFQFDTLLTLAEGKTLMPGATHVREGVVVKPLRERWSPKCGRVNLKIVSNSYLERVK